MTIRKSILVLFIFLIPAIFEQNSFGGIGNNINGLNNKVELQTLRVNVPFAINVGQYPKEVVAHAQTFTGDIFVKQNAEIVYRVNHENCGDIVLKESFINAEINNIDYENKTAATISHFYGNKTSDWQNNIPSYEALNFEDIYNGIDLRVKAYNNNIEKLFYISPGADPSQIKGNIEGTGALYLNDFGQLTVDIDGKSISFTKPVAYQLINGERQFVDVSYLIDNHTYQFKLGDYDNSQTLIIDPLIAATYLGGNAGDDDYGPSIVLDGNGYVYVCGYTQSSDFPTTSGAYSETDGNGTVNLFISKLDTGLTTLIASTYLGGSNHDVEGTIAIDENGNICVAGYTYSSNFPTTSGAYDQTFNGLCDVFITKFDSDLSTILSSTYLGGSGYEGYGWPRLGMTIDDSGNVFVAGLTLSTNLPVTPGTYDSTFNGGTGGGDVFASKLNSDLTELLGSTYLGGSSVEWRPSITLDDDNNVYISGETYSTNFPVTPGSFDIGFNGTSDVFLAKLNNELTSLISATFLGGNDVDEPLSIRAGKDNTFYVAGYAKSSNFPTTAGSFSPGYNGGERDGFISKFDDNLTTLMASTYLGGNAFENCKAIVFDTSGNLYVSGNTSSVNFPTTPGVFDDSYNGGDADMFIAQLSNDLSTLNHATYMGGTFHENGIDMTIDEKNNLYIAGYAVSRDFPVTESAYDTTYNGGDYDCIVVRHSFNRPMYLIDSVIFIDDNNDKFHDPGEIIRAYLYIKNVGDGTDSNVTFSMSSNNSDVIFNTPGTFIEEIPGYGTEVNTLSSPIEYVVPNIAQARLDTFMISIVSDYGEYRRKFAVEQAVGHIDVLIIDDDRGSIYEDIYEYDLIEQGKPPHIWNKLDDGSPTGNDLNKYSNIVWFTGDSSEDYLSTEDILALQEFLDSGGNLFLSGQGLAEELHLDDSTFLADYLHTGYDGKWFYYSQVGENGSRIGDDLTLRFDYSSAQSIYETDKIIPVNGAQEEFFYGNNPAACSGISYRGDYKIVFLSWGYEAIGNTFASYDKRSDLLSRILLFFRDGTCGDVDSNDLVNILDITFLINFLYKGGPEPESMWAADPDGNGTTNILDITYLIEYLYKAGPEPVCE